MFGRDRGGIDPVTLDDRRKEMVVLDVRDPYEWQAGHIDGAVHVPLSALAGTVGTIDRGVPWPSSAAAGTAAGPPCAS